MKRIFLLILTFTLSKVSYSQYTQQQTMGSNNTLINLGSTNGGAIKGNIINGLFADTAAANATQIDFYAGAQIFTTSDTSFWIRNKTSFGQYWFKVGGAAGGATGSFWGLTGNLFPVVLADYGVGTNDETNLPLKTNNIQRVILPYTGLALLNDTTNTKVMTFNPTSKLWGYANWLGAGAGGSGITELTGQVTAGPGSGSQAATVKIPATRIPFGDVSGNMTSSANFNITTLNNHYSLRLGGGSIIPNHVNFLGTSAGSGADSAQHSNFFGEEAGVGATYAYHSNFFGIGAGYDGGFANNSFFVGYNAGAYATNANNSIFIGQQAGDNDIVNNSGNANDYSILIGKGTSTTGFKNSVAIGGLAANSAENQMMIGSVLRPLTLVVPYASMGVGTAAPDRTLHVVGKSLFTDSLRYPLGAGAGYVLTSDADGNATWATSASALTVPINKLSAATGTNSINNAGFGQSWAWNTLQGSALTLSSSSPNSPTTNSMLVVNLTGDHGSTSSIQQRGLVINNSATGTGTNQIKFGVYSSTTGASPLNIAGEFTASGGTINTGIKANGTQYAALFETGSVGIGTSTPTTLLHVVGRSAVSQGADVASVAGAIALGTNGNSFEITGTNAITLISNVGWINGSVVNLVFTSTATLTNGTATSGTDITIILAGATNFVGSANDIVTLMLCEVGGTQAWRELSRSVN